MSKTTKEKNKKSSKESFRLLSKLKQETKHGILALVFFVLALFFTMSAFHKAGIAGDFFFDIFRSIFGYGYSLVPVIFVLLGFSFAKSSRPDIAISHTISALLFFVSSLGIMFILGGNTAGGLAGQAFSFPFLKLFDIYASLIFLFAILIISIAIMFDVRPVVLPLLKKVLNLFKRKEKEYKE